MSDKVDASVRYELKTTLVPSSALGCGVQLTKSLTSSKYRDKEYPSPKLFSNYQSFMRVRRATYNRLHYQPCLSSAPRRRRRRGSMFSEDSDVFIIYVDEGGL